MEVPSEATIASAGPLDDATNQKDQQSSYVREYVSNLLDVVE